MTPLYGVCSVGPSHLYHDPVVCFLREQCSFPVETMTFFNSIPNVFVCRSSPKDEPPIWSLYLRFARLMLLFSIANFVLDSSCLGIVSPVPTFSRSQYRYAD
jgi:hypothetical protein